MGFWRFLNDRLFNLGLRHRPRSTPQAMADVARSLERELAIDYGPEPHSPGAVWRVRSAEPTPGDLAERARKLFNAKGRRQ